MQRKAKRRMVARGFSRPNIIVLLTLIVLATLLLFSSLWFSTIRKPNNMIEESHNDDTDIARILYETRNLVGIITGIVVAVIAFFIPLATSLWTQLLDSIFGLAKYAIQQKQYYQDKNPEEHQEKIRTLDKVIENTAQLIKTASSKTRSLQIPFKICLWISFIIIFSLIILNLAPPLFPVLGKHHIVIYVFLVLLMFLVLFGVGAIILIVNNLLSWHPIREEIKLEMEILLLHLDDDAKKDLIINGM